MSIHNFPSTVAIFVPSSAVGGAEHYIKNILHLIENVGCKPTLILPKNQQVIDFFSDLSVDYLISDIAWVGGAEDLKIGKDYLNKLSKQYRETSDVLEFVNPDCAFINLPWVDFGLGITLACHELQIPTINLVHLCPWKVALNDLTKQLFQDLAAANSQFFTVSNDNRIQLSLSTGINIDSIQVFYNSRDVESKYIGITSKEYKLHRVELLDELELPLNSFLSVSVGRFSHQKNFLDIVTSFASVHSKLPNYYHLFLGEGELKKYYQEIALNLGISHKLKFLGYRKDVDRFLALSDLFISSSLYEGLALSILEAAQFFCPIIAANSSSAQEIIPDADYGLLYNPGRYYMLGKYLEFAYINPREMKKKAERLKSLCQEKFSLVKFSQDLKNILQDSLGSRVNAIYSPISVAYDQASKSLKIRQDTRPANYQYYGLPKSIVKEDNVITFPYQSYGKNILEQAHDKYLHCLHKVAKHLTDLKVILCFGSFNANFFRSYYLKDQYLLLIISQSEGDRLTWSIHHINHTYWGQEIEPDCLAKFTTFEAIANYKPWGSQLDQDHSYEHCYTSRDLLSSYLKLSNGSTLDALSINFKLIENVLKPKEYFMLENNDLGQKLKLKSISKIA